MKAALFCQYCKDVCSDYSTDTSKHLRGFFIYPSSPRVLSSTIQYAVRNLQKYSSKEAWRSWEELQTAGQIIFCGICKAIHEYNFVVANITTLNFNVLFELGYTIGLNKPVIPIRDTSFKQDEAFFDELGIFDVLGYESFQNHERLSTLVRTNEHVKPTKLIPQDINEDQPIYLVRSPVDSDGSLKILSSLKKSAFQFRNFDSRETPRLSLHEAYRQVSSSRGIVAYLLTESRKGATTHNALCAFVSGMAMAMGKHVLMLQEGQTVQPIDYRDVVISCKNVGIIPGIIEKFVQEIEKTRFNISGIKRVSPRGLLEKVDLGDTSAENESRTLAQYFIKTPQYQQVRQGHARLVIGRKGSGKTAIFYSVRDSLWQNKTNLIVDLMPEGHHFVKLREDITKYMTEGARLHTLTAFWNYILVLEVAKKLISHKEGSAWESEESLKAYDELKGEYAKHIYGSEGDFSERIMSLVNKITKEFSKEGDGKVEISSSKIVELIYKRDISKLRELVIKHLKSEQEVWVLFDNIDKGWNVHGATKADISVVKCLLEATRKMQHALEKKNINFNSVVFLRQDIYELLIDQTSDRGKESVVELGWSDVVLLKNLLKKRFSRIEEIEDDFKDAWNKVFNPHVGGEDSFVYITSRTFYQPRGVLNFIRKCIQVAISQEHIRVEEEDVKIAEGSFSEDMRKDMRFEIRDVFPKYPDILDMFTDQDRILSHEDVCIILEIGGVQEKQISKVIDILLWFSFLGVRIEDKECYSCQASRDLARLKAAAKSKQPNENIYSIHPVFNATLRLKE